MLQFIYETEEEIPEALKDHYEQHDGKWILNCEGAAPQAKVDEFRKNNIQLKKDLEKFDGIDVDRYKDLAKKEKSFEEAKADNKEKVDELLAKRTQELKDEYEKQVGDLKATTEEQHSKLETLQIDQAILTTAADLGLRKGADADVLGRARGTWKLDKDGKPLAADENGEPVYGKTGEPITMREWTEKLSKEAEHLFEPNAGSGSGGGGKGGAGDSGPNPWKSETFNLTKQAEVLRDDPDKAKRMAAAAGKTLRI